MLWVWNEPEYSGEKNQKKRFEFDVDGNRKEVSNSVEFKSVKSGSRHTLALTKNGKLYAWGNNYSGQLGLNLKDYQIGTPKEVVFEHCSKEDSIAGIACGGRHTYFWTSSGACFAFGNNFHSQLTYDYANAKYKENQYIPFKVRGLEIFAHKVREIACGGRHTLFCLENGTVTAVGCNDKGQLGRGDRESMSIVMRVEELHSIVHISCGSFHSLAVAESGKVFMWGYGKACGSLPDILLPVAHHFPEPIRRTCCGDCHSLALSEEGVVYAWGSNSHGQLGVENFKQETYCPQPNEITGLQGHGKVIEISAQELLSAALTEDGKIFYWGKAADGIEKENLQSQGQIKSLGPKELTLPQDLVPMAITCTTSSVVAIVRGINCSPDQNEVEINNHLQLCEEKGCAVE